MSLPVFWYTGLTFPPLMIRLKRAHRLIRPMWFPSGLAIWRSMQSFRKHSQQASDSRAKYIRFYRRKRNAGTVSRLRVLYIVPGRSYFKHGAVRDRCLAWEKGMWLVRPQRHLGLQVSTRVQEAAGIHENRTKQDDNSS